MPGVCLEGKESKKGCVCVEGISACGGCKREGVHVESVRVEGRVCACGGFKGGGGREDWYKHESNYAGFVTTGSGVVSLKHKRVHFGSDLLVSQPHPLVILGGS